MKERLQLNIRMDSEKELYEAIKDRAHQMNMSMSAFVISALKASMSWRLPYDAEKLIERFQEFDSEIKQIEQKYDLQCEELEKRCEQLQASMNQILEKVEILQRE